MFSLFAHIIIVIIIVAGWASAAHLYMFFVKFVITIWEASAVRPLGRVGARLGVGKAELCTAVSTEKRLCVEFPMDGDRGRSFSALQ